MLKIKKILVALLAFLIFSVSVSLEVVAKPGDYHPDIEIVFFPVYMNQLFNYENAVSRRGIPVKYTITQGPAEVPLDYNPRTGTLKYTKSKYYSYCDLNDLEVNSLFPDGDRTLGVGDYFAATVVCKNINKLFALQAAISYSKNITPTGVTITSKGSGRMKIETASLTTDPNAREFYGLYPGFNGADYYGLDIEECRLDSHGNMFIGVCGDAPYSNVSYIKDSVTEIFANPTTGVLNYKYPKTAILATFIFKITGIGPIRFAAADPYNKKYVGCTAGFYVAKNSETSMEQFTTYAVQKGCPGSQKMTFFKDWYTKSARHRPLLNSVKASKKQAIVSWTQYGGATKYEIQYSRNKNFKDAKTKRVSASKTSAKLKKLSSKKRYYFRVRAINGTLRTKWSKKKSVKVK